MPQIIVRNVTYGVICLRWFLYTQRAKSCEEVSLVMFCFLFYLSKLSTELSLCYSGYYRLNNVLADFLRCRPSSPPLRTCFSRYPTFFRIFHQREISAKFRPSCWKNFTDESQCDVPSVVEYDLRYPHFRRSSLGIDGQNVNQKLWILVTQKVIYRESKEMMQTTV